MVRARFALGVVMMALLSSTALPTPALGQEDRDIPPEPQADAEVRSRAESVVYGVIGPLSFQDGGDGTVYTIADLMPRHHYRGEQSAAPIPVITGGGQRADGSSMYYSDNAIFREGARVVMFLNRGPNARLTPVYGQRGFFDIDQAAGGSGSPCVAGSWFCLGSYAFQESELPISWRYRSSGEPFGTALNYINAAFEDWDDDATSNAEFAYGGTTTASYGVDDDVNAVTWEGGSCGAVPPDQWGGCTAFFAAEYCWGEGYFLCYRERDVKFKLDVRWVELCEPDSNCSP